MLADGNDGILEMASWRQNYTGQFRRMWPIGCEQIKRQSADKPQNKFKLVQKPGLILF